MFLFQSSLWATRKICVGTVSLPKTSIPTSVSHYDTEHNLSQCTDSPLFSPPPPCSPSSSPLCILLSLPWLLLLRSTFIWVLILPGVNYISCPEETHVFVSLSVIKLANIRDEQSLTIMLHINESWWYIKIKMPKKKKMPRNTHMLLFHCSFWDWLIYCFGVGKSRLRIIKPCLDSWQKGNAFLSFSVLNYSAAALAQ